MEKILSVIFNYWALEDPRLKTIIAHKAVTEVPLSPDSFFIPNPFFIEELAGFDCYLTGDFKIHGNKMYYHTKFIIPETRIVKPWYLEKNNTEVNNILKELESKNWNGIVHRYRFEFEYSSAFKIRYT